MDIAKARNLTKEFMIEHGISGWRVEFSNRMTISLGSTKYYSRVIMLNKRWIQVAPDREVIDTILHEIAHVIAGPHARHGEEWKAVARSLGATPSARVESTPIPGVRYKGICGKCGHEILRQQRRPSRSLVHTPCYDAGYRQTLTWIDTTTGSRVALAKKNLIG